MHRLDGGIHHGHLHQYVINSGAVNSICSLLFTPCMLMMNGIEVCDGCSRAGYRFHLFNTGTVVDIFGYLVQHQLYTRLHIVVNARSTAPQGSARPVKSVDQPPHPHDGRHAGGA